MKKISALFAFIAFFASIDPSTQYENFGERPKIMRASKKYGDQVATHI